MPIPPTVESLLKQCDTGLAALKVFNDNKLDVETTNSGAIAFFDPGDATHKKRVVLNVSNPSAKVAAYFSHEMYHAKKNADGTSADAKTLDVDAYVEKMVQEEADGTAIGFRCYFELERKGLTSGVAPDRYDFYKHAFEAGRKQAADAGTGDPDAAGFARAAKMVRVLINDRFLGANNLQSYADYYRQDWYSQHKK